MHITALVRHSQKLSWPPLKAVKQSGEVICTHCSCVPGLGEVCSNVAAVLRPTSEPNSNLAPHDCHVLGFLLLYSLLI